MNIQSYYTLCQSTEARDVLVGHAPKKGDWYLIVKSQLLYVLDSDNDRMSYSSAIFIPDFDYLQNEITAALAGVKWATLLGRLMAWVSSHDNPADLMAADMKETLLRYLIHLKTAK